MLTKCSANLGHIAPLRGSDERINRRMATIIWLRKMEMLEHLFLTPDDLREALQIVAEIEN